MASDDPIVPESSVGGPCLRRMLKVLCYNGVVLIRSALELGVDLSMIEAAGPDRPAFPLATRGEAVGVRWALGGCEPVQLP